MKKFLIGLVAGFVLTGLTAVVLVFALARVGESRPAVQDASTLVLNLQGPVPERAPMELPFSGLRSQTPVTVHGVWRMLHAAANDPKISAVVLTPRGVDLGWGKMQEIRESLLAYKKSGKPLFAYLDRPSAREYYLATAADRIYMAQEDVLNLKGLRIEALYLEDTLDKIGVKVQVEHAGKYKNAGDILSRNSMTPETREVYNSLLDELYGSLVNVIAESRGLTDPQVRETIDNGPFLAQQALDAHLIDGLEFEDQMYDELKSKLGQDALRKLPHTTYDRYLSLAGDSRKQVALVVASGMIIGGSGEGWADQEAIFSKDFIRTLHRVRDNEKIQGVILRLDSGGGDAIASDEILHEVRLLRDKKPMVISMSDTAASGAYYMAMTGDPIIAYPNTLTGSIGVLFGKADLRGLYDKLGAKKEIMTRGRYAAIDSDYVPLDEDGLRKLREGVDAVYDRFLTVVSEGLDRPRSEIEPLAQGRVWLGDQAYRNGLVTELGGFDRAVALIKEKTGIPAEEDVRLVDYPLQRSFWDYLLGQAEQKPVSAQVDSILSTLGVDHFSAAELTLLRRGAILRMMPYRFDIR